MRKFFLGLIFCLCAPWAAAGTVTIAALGDSLTQGYGLPSEQGFVPQLEAWLAAQGADVALINAGVSGDTTAGGAARVGWTLSEDVDAMIVTLGGNDLLRGLAPEVTRANLEAILQEAKKTGVPVAADRHAGAGQLRPRLQGRLRRDLSGAGGGLWRALCRELLCRAGGAARRSRRDDPLHVQLDGIHPSAEGVERIVAALGPKVLELVARAEGG